MAYVVLTYPGGVAACAFDAMVEALVASGEWRAVHRAYRLAVFTAGAAPPPVTPLVGARGPIGVIIGQVFDRAATHEGAVAKANLAGLTGDHPLETARRLISTAWGAYVAVWIGEGAAGPVVLRDPSGELEALT